MPNSRLWGVATFGGWILGIAIGWLTYTGMALLFSILIAIISPGSSDEASWARLLFFGHIGSPLAITLGWVGVGIIVSYIQKIIIERWIRTKSRWVIVTVKSWIIGLIVYSVIKSVMNNIIPDPVYPPPTTSELVISLIIAAVLGGIYGFVIGVITGKQLYSLVEQVSA
jgi:hypothetical protein